MYNVAAMLPARNRIKEFFFSLSPGRNCMPECVCVCNVQKYCKTEKKIRLSGFVQNPWGDNSNYSWTTFIFSIRTLKCVTAECELYLYNNNMYYLTADEAGMAAGGVDDRHHVHPSIRTLYARSHAMLLLITMHGPPALEGLLLSSPLLLRIRKRTRTADGVCEFERYD